MFSLRWVVSVVGALCRGAGSSVPVHPLTQRAQLRHRTPGHRKMIRSAGIFALHRLLKSRPIYPVMPRYMHKIPITPSIDIPGLVDQRGGDFTTEGHVAAVDIDI